MTAPPNFFDSSIQSDPINALVEKLTNSFDALLLKYCKIMKIDPTGKLAPKTMRNKKKIPFVQGKYNMGGTRYEGGEND